MRTKAFVLEAIYEKCSVFKYLKVLQFDNGSKFENNGTKFLEKHYVDVRRAAIKYKHTHSAFVETFNKKLARWLFKSMDAQELKILKRVSTILVKNLKGVVNKMIKTKLSMIDIKSNDVTKKDIVELDKSDIS